jgi:hypothetical protein
MKCKVLEVLYPFLPFYTHLRKKRSQYANINVGSYIQIYHLVTTYVGHDNTTILVVEYD